MAGPWEEFAPKAAPAAAAMPWEEFAAKPSVTSDIVKSVPDAVASGLTGFAGTPGGVINWLTKKGNQALGLTDVAPPPNSGPSRYADSGDYKKAVEGVTGELYKPQTSAGKIAHAGVESLSNPLSYLGPGGAILKTGGAILSGTGSEAAGQATEGTAAEPYARVAGALLGGVAGAKALGPTIERAATPTSKELIDVASKGYDAARNSGLTLDPKGVGSWASTVEQKLNGSGFTGGKNGTAPKTMGALADLQSAPAGATVSASNLDTIRKTLRNISEEIQPTAGGAIKPTPDAAAASKALEQLGKYTENIPPAHVVAGDAAAYVRETKQANANYAAGMRTKDFDARLTKAENATDRQIAGSLDSQIKSKAGQLLDRGGRGLNDAEKAQLQLINSGTPVSNTLRQLGRAGAGVIPMGLHVAGAVASGGASVPASLGIGIPLYAARKISEGMTKSRAAQLAEMLAQRSPEYERRVSALPTVDTSPNKAAIARALLGVH